MNERRLFTGSFPGGLAALTMALMAVAGCGSAASVASTGAPPAVATAAASAALPFAPSEMKVQDVTSRLEGLVVVDVRFRVDFDESHVPGAISLPLAEIEQRYQELPRGKPLVVYAEANECG